MRHLLAVDQGPISQQNSPLVLIVEDEAILRLSMARGLGRLPGVEIAHAGNLKDAREIIAVLTPRVVITDLDLPDGSGTELIVELENRGAESAIIVVSAYVDTHQRELSMRPDIELREKPVPLDQLRQLVRDKLGLTTNLDEPRQPFSAVDYVQLACMGQRSVELTVMAGDKLHGRVQILRGELWSAADQAGSGSEALRRVLFHTSGRIDVCALDPTEAMPRNLEDNWQWLLMEAARIADEVSRDEIPVPPVNPGDPGLGAEPVMQAKHDDVFGDCDIAVPHLAEAPHITSSALGTSPQPGIDRIVLAGSVAPGAEPPVLSMTPDTDVLLSTPAERPSPLTEQAQQFRRLYDEGVEALLCKRYHDAYHLLSHANLVSPGDRTVTGNLERLRQMGYAPDEEVLR